MPATSTRGFTLVELAVVFAIVGLMAGGVLATSSYLKSARLTNTVNEAKTYVAAMKQFQTMYAGSVAGDMSNATEYWGDGGGCPSTIASGTCNGDGNGKVDTMAERFLTFQHLMKAELINGNYTGLTGPGGTKNAVIGANVPTLSQDGISMYFDGTSSTAFYSGSTTSFDGNYGSYFAFVGRILTSNSMPNGPWLSAQQARELDEKFDNGMPATGWILAYEGDTSCVTDANVNDADETYLATDTPDTCRLLLLNL